MGSERSLTVARRFGIGVAIGVVLAAVDTTGFVRGLLVAMMTSPNAPAPHPVAVFAANLAQTVLLVWITLHAYRNDNAGIAAVAWVLATWEAIATVTDADIGLSKAYYPQLYSIAASIHVVGAAATLLVLGGRAYREKTFLDDVSGNDRTRERRSRGS